MIQSNDYTRIELANLIEWPEEEEEEEILEYYE